MRSTVNPPALAVLIALSIGSNFDGILGALISVPTAALLSVIIDEWFTGTRPDLAAASIEPELLAALR
jgi:predicted PurR-regulated permease PerM